MDAFTVLTGLVAPLDRVNVDTDQIIPKQYLKTIKRTGLREGLFTDWRYGSDGSPNPDFFLNQPRYQGATILLARDNFGCGSSREHAPWALLDYGFRCMIAPSFADIFFNNCFKNGMLPVVLQPAEVAHLFRHATQSECAIALSEILTEAEEARLPPPTKFRLAVYALSRAFPRKGSSSR